MGEFDYIQLRIEQYRKDEIGNWKGSQYGGLLSSPERGDSLEILISDDKDAQRVRNWLKKEIRIHSEQIFAEINGIQCSPLEAELFGLHFCFLYGVRRSDWDTAPNEQRLRHAIKVSKLARKLARALEETPHPEYSSVINFLSRKNMRNALLVQNLILHIDERGLKDELIPSFLKRLAVYAEASPKTEKPDMRPNVPGSELRIFARQLGEYFDTTFGKQPYQVIASCVALKFPDSDVYPTAESVRKWLGKK